MFANSKLSYFWSFFSLHESFLAFISHLLFQAYLMITPNSKLQNGWFKLHKYCVFQWSTVFIHSFMYINYDSNRKQIPQ